MLLKKFQDFLDLKTINEYFNTNKHHELIINKDELINKMKEVGKNQDNWGHGEDEMAFDLREVFYKIWQDKDNDAINSYSDMVEYALEKYGALPAFTILVTSYIGQVNNGGHAQYFDNGYASRGGQSSGVDDLELHDLMLSLWKEVGINDFSKSAKLCYNVASQVELEKRAEDCQYCDGSGQEEYEEEYEDDDGDTYTETEYSTCGNCGGSGEEDSNEYEIINNDVLDKKLYESNGRFLHDLDRFLAVKLLD